MDVEISGGALVVTRTSTFVPGSFALSGVVTEVTPAGIAPVEGVAVYGGIGDDIALQGPIAMGSIPSWGCLTAPEEW